MKDEEKCAFGGEILAALIPKPLPVEGAHLFILPPSSFIL
jgi:hypothetical protein